MNSKLLFWKSKNVPVWKVYRTVQILFLIWRVFVRLLFKLHLFTPLYLILQTARSTPNRDSRVSGFEPYNNRFDCPPFKKRKNLVLKSFCVVAKKILLLNFIAIGTRISPKQRTAWPTHRHTDKKSN